ncbi:MAG: hypothetical protein FWJ85_10905 [Solitalea sp.]
MKKSYSLYTVLFLLLIVTLPGCDIVVGIFKAGVWVGVILVIAVLVLIIWLIRKLFR